MADRYYWGTTKMDKVRVRKWIDLDEQDSAPAARKGRFYLDTDGKIQISSDGTVFEVLGSQS